MLLLNTFSLHLPLQTFHTWMLVSEGVAPVGVSIENAGVGLHQFPILQPWISANTDIIPVWYQHELIQGSRSKLDFSMTFSAPTETSYQVLHSILVQQNSWRCFYSLIFCSFHQTRSFSRKISWFPGLLIFFFTNFPGKLPGNRSIRSNRLQILAFVWAFVKRYYSNWQ